MTTTSPAYYDATMTGRGEPSMLPWHESPWLPLYREAARWIPKHHPVSDLGTGTGTFLRVLEAEGHHAHRYGVDFSEAAIKVAYSRLTTSANTVEVGDLREWEPDPLRDGNTTYTCLEVLEHLEDDHDLVRRIPPGHQFVFSVPNYESASHLRWFRSAGEVWKRYDRLLTFRRWTRIALDERKVIHCCDTTRRSDSW